MSTATGAWGRLLNTPETARQLKISGRTLEKYRYRGTGPVFLKIGGRVLYAQEDLDDWLETVARRSTRDRGRRPRRRRRPVPRGRSVR